MEISPFCWLKCSQNYSLTQLLRNLYWSGNEDGIHFNHTAIHLRNISSNLKKELKLPDLSFSLAIVVTLELCGRIVVNLWVYFSVRNCDFFLCFAPFFPPGFIVLTSLFPLFNVTGEFYRFLERRWAKPFLTLTCWKQLKPKSPHRVPHSGCSFNALP